MKEFIAKIKDGRLPVEVARSIVELIKSMDGATITLTIKQYAKKRSLNQNDYYWSVVVPPITAFMRDAGNDVDDEEVHEYLKTHVGKLRRVVVTPDGEVLKIPGSTARLTKGEMEDYLEKVRAWVAGWGITIPQPNEGILYERP